MSDIAFRILVTYSVMNWQGQRHWIVAWLQNDTYSVADNDRGQDTERHFKVFLYVHKIWQSQTIINCARTHNFKMHNSDMEGIILSLFFFF